MKMVRVDLSSWTASFRYPNLISGIQPTLDVPPLSTVLGLLNAAAGRYLTHDEGLQIGYYFAYAARGIDLETTYQIESGAQGQPTNVGKANIMQREFLFEARLSLYLPDMALAGLFQTPVFALLLGRSGDLATVEKVQEVDLPELSNATRIKGQVVPFLGNHLPGKLQALPKYFTNTLPRRNLGTEPFSIIRYDAPDLTSRLAAYRDETQGKQGVDIFLHQIRPTDLQ